MVLLGDEVRVNKKKKEQNVPGLTRVLLVHVLTALHARRKIWNSSIEGSPSYLPLQTHTHVHAGTHARTHIRTHTHTHTHTHRALTCLDKGPETGFSRVLGVVGIISIFMY